jgi:hypothetical protein
LRREPPPSFTPTPASPVEVGDALVGPVVWTIDARSEAAWAYFDFSRGSTVPPGDPLGWDIAVRRFRIIANGGDRFHGRAGIIDLGNIAFDSVHTAPDSAYVETTVLRRDSSNAAISKWYEYGFTSHLLMPRPNVWVVRTADGRYAKMQILGYYCPAATPGCLTIRYVYQGSGSRSLVPTTE